MSPRSAVNPEEAEASKRSRKTNLDHSKDGGGAGGGGGGSNLANYNLFKDYSAPGTPTAPRPGASPQQKAENLVRERTRAGGGASFFSGLGVTTPYGRRVYMLKITFLTLVPIVALIGVNISSLVSNITQTLHAIDLKQEIEFSLDVAKVIQVLGKERGISAVVMSNLNRKTEKDMEDILTNLAILYAETDRAISNMSAWPEAVSEELQRAGDHFSTKSKIKEFLGRHRSDINPRTASQEINFYAAVIEVFLDWLYANMKDAKIEESWPSLVAYELFTSSLENIGMERSLGRVYYTNGHFDSDNNYLEFVFQYHVGLNYLHFAGEFDAYVTNRLDYYLSDKKYSIMRKSIDVMRKDILDSRFVTRESSFQMARWWYDNVTDMVEIMSKVHNDFATVILQDVQNEMDNIFRALAINVVLFVSMIIFCPITVMFVHVLTRDLQNNALTLVDKTSLLDMEKDRTDRLLFEMLPFDVANTLKDGRKVEPKAYNNSTVMFADIVDFSKISADCSPMQVVDMLNNIYNTFDNRLERYDVYKVETIGDGYMVVSGVPNENGDNHAKEIATTALDLREHIQRVEIPHLPNKRFQIRIGINTGPVVAGVVGIRMPRYCLFGDAVNTAARMESLSIADHIQMTENTKNFLDETNTGGDFLIELRGHIEVKGKGKMITYWLVEKNQTLPSGSKDLSTILGQRDLGDARTNENEKY